jgi:uncharacterized protein YyaL (SSP411 family)
MRGGFGRAPKFLGTFSLRWMWWYAQNYAHKESEEQVLLSISQMLMGGIYDQIGGGICRYSTDEHWLVPHFEKMLYDNALLMRLLADIHSAKPSLGYDKSIEHIAQFIKTTFTNKDGLFYSALDADSEGVEGKYYVWTSEEIDLLLGKDSSWYKGYYNITEEGNWEKTNILHRKMNDAEFAEKMNWSLSEFDTKLFTCNEILLTARQKRVAPGLDNKIQLSWNALMNTAYSTAFLSTGHLEYLEVATKNMDAIKLKCDNWKNIRHILNNDAQVNYFLEDLAYLGEALLMLYQASGKAVYVLDALEIAKLIDNEFNFEDSVFYSFARQNQADNLLAKAEYYDGATPAANSVIHGFFQQLSSLSNDIQWQSKAEAMNPAILSGLKQFPSSFSNWAMHFTMQFAGMKEISINPENQSKASIQGIYDPFKLIIYAGQKPSIPAASTQINLEKNQIQLCHKQSCYPLYETWEELCAEHYHHE